MYSKQLAHVQPHQEVYECSAKQIALKSTEYKALSYLLLYIIHCKSTYEWQMLKSQVLFLSQNVKPLDCRISQRNWVFATNWHFLTPIASQPDGVNLWYFKLRISDLIE